MTLHQPAIISNSKQSIASLEAMKIPRKFIGQQVTISQIGQQGVSFEDSHGDEWHLGIKHVKNVFPGL